jgi:succinate-semialdehyde dehydrogenase/glutarate-semialdehyde dehydrogenase
MSNSAATITVRNPATGGTVGEVANHSVGDCLAAVSAAHEAFGTWRSTAPRERGEILRRAFELMMAEQDRLSELMVRENGKVLSDARAEVAYAAEFFRWFSEEAVRIDGDLRRAPNGANWLAVTREPIGVALCVTPWNFPAAMATRKIGPALAAGCTVVLKAAAETPLSALAVAEILARAGLPEGVLHVVTPDPPAEAVHAMLASGLVRKLSFTGSTRVGSLLLAQAAEKVVKCSMELGGNAPFIVCEDADVDAAVDGAMLAKMRNGGAACTAANRFYVHSRVHDAFVGALTRRMSALRLGDGLDPATTVGPLVSAAQQQRVSALVARALEDGARLMCGGTASPAPMHGYEPTVLTGVEQHHRIVTEEVFGPVAPIIEVDDIEASIPLFNGVDHGLVSYIYTGDIGRGMRLANQLETGMVGLNRGLVSDPAAPFGGVKQSGIGREGAHEGLLEFCETKYISTQW